MVIERSELEITPGREAEFEEQLPAIRAALAAAPGRAPS